MSKTYNTPEHLKSRKFSIGDVYGFLTVIREGERHGKNARQHYCSCVCGNEILVTQGHLRNGHTRSCGCRTGAMISRSNITHGSKNHRAYGSWLAMKQRCLNKKHKQFKDYGGRGIMVCKYWLEFDNFFSDMGERPEGNFSVDRVNNDGHYNKSNCKWSTSSEQHQNTPRSILDRGMLFQAASLRGAGMKWTRIAPLLCVKVKTLHGAFAPNEKYRKWKN